MIKWELIKDLEPPAPDPVPDIFMGMGVPAHMLRGIERPDPIGDIERVRDDLFQAAGYGPEDSENLVRAANRMMLGIAEAGLTILKAAREFGITMADFINVMNTERDPRKKRDKILSHRKNKSQAKNWSKWKRRRR